MTPYEKRMRQIPAPFIDNGDGSKSTHLMAAEVDDKGNWYAFPTIQQGQDGLLRELPLREAQAAAIGSGNAKAFGKDKESALRYAGGGYKQGTPLDSDMEKQRRIAALLRGQ